MNPVDQAPEAQIRRKRNFSIIWIVPVVALLIGGWLIFKAWSEKGPEITISLESADGLEANKTKVRFKDVVVGTVTEISLNPDFTGVIATVEMDRESDSYMTDKTQFWVVRARVAAGEISGLGTLLSGAYIGCNPSKEGKPTRTFVALKTPPVVTAGMPGRHFLLESPTLGSLDIGSPVYYRGIKVGQVVEYNFDNAAESVDLRVFVNAPYHEKVMRDTRFWNASGIDVSLGAEGVKVDTQSLVSVLLGGVAFDLPRQINTSGPAEEDQVFALYANHEESKQKTYAVKRYLMMYFDQSVRGLAPDAPVELMGIKLGEVVDVKLELNADDLSARIAVLVVIEPERIDTIVANQRTMSGKDSVASDQQAEENILKLIGKGLRAQLKTGNLLTGQLYVDLDFYPDAPPVEAEIVNGRIVFPTIPAPFEQIVNRVDNILEKFEKLPLEEIGQEVHVAVRELSGTLREIKQVSGNINRETLPRVNADLDALQDALREIEWTFGADSALSYNARIVLNEMELTIRSLRALFDYLERNPQSLIFGKGEGK